MAPATDCQSRADASRQAGGSLGFERELRLAAGGHLEEDVEATGVALGERQIARTTSCARAAETARSSERYDANHSTVEIAAAPEGRRRRPSLPRFPIGPRLLHLDLVAAAHLAVRLGVGLLAALLLEVAQHRLAHLFNGGCAPPHARSPRPGARRSWTAPAPASRPGASKREQGVGELGPEQLAHLLVVAAGVLGVQHERVADRGRLPAPAAASRSVANAAPASAAASARRSRLKKTWRKFRRAGST